DNVYVYEQPSRRPIMAEVAIGSNPAEVTAAFFAARFKGGDTFESLLNALQFGLLDRLVQPDNDQLARLRQMLHEKEFVAADAGTINVIVNPVPNASLKQDPHADALDLPLKLADDLNELNKRQQEYGLSRAHLAEYRWQVYADWYRLAQDKGGTPSQQSR